MIWTDKKGIKHSDYYISGLTCAICMDCKHFIGMGNMQPTCYAFPNGIPEDVWTGTIMHTKAINGDNGFHYEKIVMEDTDLPELLYDED